MRRGAGLRSAWPISGNKAEALALLSPLMARGDAAGARTRAFVLALTGDAGGAKIAIEAAMPGSSSQHGLFLPKLPIAPVRPEGGGGESRHLPGCGRADGIRAAAGDDERDEGHPAQSDEAERPRLDEDRIGSIERWLSQATQRQCDCSATRWLPQPPQQVASASIPRSLRRLRTLVQRHDLREPQALDPARKRAECDRASRAVQQHEGPQPRAVRGHKRLHSEEPGRARLLIGPFRNDSESEYFRRRPCVGPH